MFVIISGLERVEPLANGFTQRLNFKSAVNFRKQSSFRSRPEQISRPFQICPGIVVKRGCHLNQPLKEHFVRVRRLEPDFFPMLVRLVEMLGIERFQPFLIQPGLFVRIQARFWAL